MVTATAAVAVAGFAGPPGPPGPPAKPSQRPARAAVAGAAADSAAVQVAPKVYLDSAADQEQLPRSLVEAVAWWESGWDMSRVSSTGAVGFMQVQPDAEADMAPRLIGRRADLRDPADNSLIGSAMLRAYIGDFGGDVGLGLAAYYQGEGSVRQDGLYPDTEQYVSGITALERLFRAGGTPPLS